ncbi:hypothetical protein PI124_g5930 [Phytophthora idaei]|nr:hypothetical protein PI125_g2600 [Phytophthora idaei]KAG3167005.1 hypothetical protein PI126_g3969 [Phytophthora idaei]KAG3249432.1 hypothetical protein PI124_g5930 [Phytophthora idaei]
MRQGFVLLVFAVVLLASCGAASPPTDAISIFKVEPPNQFQSPVAAANNDIRFLRNRGADVVDEERESRQFQETIRCQEVVRHEGEVRCCQERGARLRQAHHCKHAS